MKEYLALLQPAVAFQLVDTATFFRVDLKKHAKKIHNRCNFSPRSKPTGRPNELVQTISIGNSMKGALPII